MLATMFLTVFLDKIVTDERYHMLYTKLSDEMDETIDRTKRRL